MPHDGDVLEITIQRRNGDIFPVVAEHHRPDAILPVRSEGSLKLAAEPRSKLPDAYGTELGQALFRDAIRDRFVSACANKAGGVRVLVFVEAEELKTWRWEWLCAPVDSMVWDFLSLDQRTLYSIYLPSLTDRLYPPIGRSDLRVLVLVANPSDAESKYGLASFDVDRNVARLREVFAERLPVEVLARTSGATGLPTLDGLATALTRGSHDRPHTILHVVCHGRYDPDGETTLFLEQNDVSPITGRVLAQPVGGTELIDRLRRVARLPYLVFLSTCESAAPEAEQRLGGLAQRLVRELGIPAVIGMTERVSIATAHLLADEFYRRLLAQRDVGEVDRALVQAYAGLASRRDVNVPALYSRLRAQPFYSDLQDSLPSDAELAAGLAQLDKLLVDRAPVLRPEAAKAALKLQATLATAPNTLTAAALSDREQALSSLNVVCQEAIEISFYALARGVRPPAYDARQPFPGQSPFRSNNSEFYFGREALVRRLADKLAADNFLAVLGPSGSGKSSLVLAGLAPLLKANEPGVQIIDDFVPGSDPLEQLALRQGWIAPGPVVYIVDQFEELFTVCTDEAQRAGFIDELLGLAQSSRIVITMRADFWGECARYPELASRMLAQQELIGPMSSIELRGAIEQQAARVQLRFEADLSNTMLDEVIGEPGAMPLLQHALLELWKRRHGRWLKSDEYRSIGGVKQAIAESADRFYNTLSAEEKDRMRDIFLRLTRLDDTAAQGESRRDTRRRLNLAELVPTGSDPNQTKALVKRLADTALLVTSQNRVQGEVEVAHESLIRHWSRLGQWIDADIVLVRTRESVRQAALEWNQQARDDDFLQHTGRRYEDAKVLLDGGRLSLNSSEFEYLGYCAQKDRDIRLNPGLHNLQETGWGIIFTVDADPAEREALRPLLDRRKQQASRRHPSRYREFRGDLGYRPGETIFDFLARQGLGVGQDDPDQVPRFLLLVGDPQKIPFEAQYLLSQMGYAVGRVHFKTSQEYGNYASSVVAAEQATRPRSRRLSFFAPHHTGDMATNALSNQFLPRFEKSLGQRFDEWEIVRNQNAAATKSRLLELLRGSQAASLYLFGSHGMSFPLNDPRQLREQGAILCSDWPGFGKPSTDHYLAAHEVADDCDLLGAILFLFVESSAGMPKFSNFQFTADEDSAPRQIANGDFLAPLSVRLLSLSRAPLAIIGHVDTTWTHTIVGEQRSTEADFYSVLYLFVDMMRGYPIGAAMRHLRDRYNALRSSLDALQALRERSERQESSLRVGMIDARNWIILGDPAVRLVFS